MKKKNTLLIVCSVLIGIAAAVATVLVLLKKLEKEKAQFENSDLIFENDFEDAEDEAQSEDEAEL